MIRRTYNLRQPVAPSNKSMYVFGIGFIIIVVVAWFVHPLFVVKQTAGEERINVETAVRILRTKGYDAEDAREFLQEKDTDNDGYITFDEWDSAKASFSTWLTDNAPPETN
jgi:hypothetical protein